MISACTCQSCPQIALFLIINGNKNCKLSYHNLHTIELDFGSKYEEPKSDHSQLDMPGINTEQSQNKNIAKYLMDKLYESGDIVLNNVNANQAQPSIYTQKLQTPENGNKIHSKYEELMAAMRMNLKNIGKTKQKSI